jgi:hypothetical protein
VQYTAKQDIAMFELEEHAAHSAHVAAVDIF